MAKYSSTKTYGTERGMSCAFRQWKADSHCNQIHGYSLGFRFIFEADVLDERNWVYDFGDTEWIKDYLVEAFDHVLVVAKDDPLLSVIRDLEHAGGCTMRIVDAVGCEKFAESTYLDVAPLVAARTKNRVRLTSVEVFEHGSNSAIYIG